jgi:hypothetical protein
MYTQGEIKEILKEKDIQRVGGEGGGLVIL